ncbi:MAG: glycoside hydrolase domain-containing protein [Pikeienuella sp.]
MDAIIDTAWAVGSAAAALSGAGCRTVIRYYNHRNSSRLPSKRLERAEAEALSAAGLSLAVVFQQRGGAGGHLSDLDATAGARDGARALDCAARVGQPEGSAIYFAVDHDFLARERAEIRLYFAALRRVLANRYRLGVYGSGALGAELLECELADYVWLAGARGWSGTRQMLAEGGWALFQSALHLNWNGISYDANIVGASGEFGAFTPLGCAPATSPLPPIRPTMSAR